MKTWDEIESFDDAVLPEERRIIRKVEGERDVRCPFLKKDGRFWYFCGVKAPVDHWKLSPDDLVYQAHVDTASLQLFCMGDYRRCHVYPRDPAVSSAPGE